MMPKPSAPKLVLINDALEYPAFSEQTRFRRGYCWQSDNFRSQILARAKPIERRTACVGKVFEPLSPASDREVADEIGTEILFQISELYPRIGQLTDLDPGPLARSGRFNYFFADVFVISLRYDGRGAIYKWIVDSSLSGHQANRCIGTGDRIFTCPRNEG